LRRRTEKEILEHFTPAESFHLNKKEVFLKFLISQGRLKMYLKCFLLPLLIVSSTGSASPSCPPPVTFQIATTNLSEKCSDFSDGPTKGIIYDIKVIDGDTLKAKWTVPYPTLETIYLRIAGMDAPELFHPKCQKEKELALLAKLELEDIISGKFHFDILEWDKYGGRILVNLISETKESVPDLLVSKGLAVYYHGEEKQKDWCAE